MPNRAIGNLDMRCVDRAHPRKSTLAVQLCPVDGPIANAVQEAFLGSRANQRLSDHEQVALGLCAVSGRSVGLWRKFPLQAHPFGEVVGVLLGGSMAHRMRMSIPLTNGRRSFE